MYAPGGAAGGGVARFAFKDTVLQDLPREGGGAGGEGHPQPRRQVGRHRARHQAEGEQPDPDPAPRLQGSGEGEGSARPHRAARVQDRGRREPGPRRRSRRSCRVARAPAPASRSRCREGGCWTGEPVELPTGGSRATTVVAANTRAELEKLIQQKLEPLLDPQKNVIGIGEAQVGQGPVRTAYYRTYLLRAKTELTGDYIADALAARSTVRAARPARAPGGGLHDVRRGRAADGEAHDREHAAPHGDRARRQGRDRAVHPGRDLHQRADHARVRPEPAGDVRRGERDRARAQGRRAPCAGDHLRGADRRRHPRARAREAAAPSRPSSASGSCSSSWSLYYRASGLIAERGARAERPRSSSPSWR